MTPKVFTKLLGLFVLLLVFQTVVMEFVFRGMVERSAGETFPAGARSVWAGVYRARWSPFLWLPGRPAASLCACIKRVGLCPPHCRRRS